MTSSAEAAFVDDITSAVDWSPFEEFWGQALAELRANVPLYRGSEDETGRKLQVLEVVTDLAIFNVLKGLLQFPSADSQAQASKLADSIVYFCLNPPATTEDDDRDAVWVVWKVWQVLFAMVSYIPPDHVWQDLLVSVVALVREKNDNVIECGEEVDGRVFWKDLKEFDMVRTEVFHAGPPKKGLKGTEEERQDLSYSRWKNLHSFGARLGALSLDWREDLSSPLMALEWALESDLVDEKWADCVVWVACEWLIRCAPQIIQWVNEPSWERDGSEKKDEHGKIVAFIPPGPRYPEGRSQIGTERWEFWKERLGELAANEFGNMKLSSATEERIVEALKSMNSAEGTAEAAGQDTTKGQGKD